MFSRVVVGGALGGVGKRIIQLFGRASTVEVDIRPGVGVICADFQCPDLKLVELLRIAEVVVLALPDRIIDNSLTAVSQLVSPGCLVVDTASVKVPVCEHKSSQALFERISINPLFGPDLEFAGRTVCIVPINRGKKAVAFEEMLTAAGLSLLWLTPEEHDRAAAIQQCFVHLALLLIGQVFSDFHARNWVAAKFSTPNSTLLNAMIARMLRNNEEMYWAIHSNNVFFPDVYAAMKTCLRSLDNITEQEFRMMWSSLRETWPGNIEHDADFCHKVFGYLNSATSS